MAMNWQADASANQSLSQKQDESKDQHLGGAGMNDQMSSSNIHQMDYGGNDIASSSYNNNGITSIPSTSNIVTPNSNTYNCNGNNNNNNIAWASNSNGNFHNNNINYNNNNNINNNINNNNNNYNDNTGDRSNSMTILDGCVCILLVICIILGITALVSDTLTIHSFEYCAYSIEGSYPYYYSYSCNHMCEIEYGMHQFRVVECDKESFESTDYYTLCTTMTSSALYFPLYCSLKWQGDIYETSTIIGLVSHILALLIFIVLQKHIRCKHLCCCCDCLLTIFVFGMVVTLLASPVALAGWQINNDINGFTGMYSYSYVKNKETAWGISIWCTVIIMAFNTVILIMTRIVCFYNKVRAKSSNNNKGIKSARQEATSNETVRLNSGSVNMPPQIVSYNNNNNNNNQSPYGWAHGHSYPQHQPQQQY